MICVVEYVMCCRGNICFKSLAVRPLTHTQLLPLFLVYFLIPSVAAALVLLIPANVAD